MTKQKVLIVHNYYQIPGGEDTVVANEKKMLEEHGHEVVLYTRHNSELKTMSKFKKLLLPFTTIFNFRTYREIKKIIRNEHIDIVHVHNTLNLISPSVYYAASKCRVPVFQTIHNFRLLCPGATFYRDGHICEDCVTKGLKCAVKHKCYRGSKLQTLACVINSKIHRMTGIYRKINYICLTEFNKEKLLMLNGIDPERVFIKPNFVKTNLDSVPEQERLDQFVFAGRLDKLKGIDILFEAWKTMGQKTPLLIVCGTGPMENWCKKEIEQNHLNIEMKGFLPNNEVRFIIAESKAMLLPTQWYEGFPMSMVESFSVGIPVICSDLGNAGSLIEDGVNGLKFSSCSPEALAFAVNKIAQCPDIYPRTFSLYKEKYTEDHNYRQLIEIYDSIKTY
ncbi:MAG: glycosyltransferase family 4 protein [Ruminococcus sp.]|nr:glycosyltransferase family 4 protein [Ruminococcus sp.]